jgi:pilus assembly protein Flp/PilA
MTAALRHDPRISMGFQIYQKGTLGNYTSLGRKCRLPDKIQRILVFCPHTSRMKIIRMFLADTSGATAIEYGQIAAGISLAIIAVVNGLGAKLNTKFTSINSSLK